MRNRKPEMILRCTGLALLVSGVFVLLPGTALAQSNVCPPGAPPVGAEHTTGLPTTKSCPPEAASGASYQCTFNVSNADLNHCVENLTFTDTSPFPGGATASVQCFQNDPTTGTPVAVTVLAWSGAPGNADTCTGTITVPAVFNCSGADQTNTDHVDATGTDAGPAPYNGLPGDGGASGTTSIPPLVCADNNACTTDTCDTNNGCVFTPISCNDSNACTTDTCDAINGCAHTAVSCNDSNACTTDTCDAVNGCAHTPISCNDSNACTTDTCDATNGCVHTAISCDDSNACTTDTCDATNGCVHTAISCDDSNACTTDTCDATNGCAHAAISCDDNNSCTDDTCDATNGCVHTDNGTCNTTEICRTPGFWGTHACPGGTQSSLGVCEKSGSTNITQTVLDNYPGLTICGHPINTTDLTNTSAVEAICVAVKGDSTLQVARQLTAAALNCIVSNSTGCGGAGQNATDVCGGVSIDAVFTACNDPANACATTATLTDGTVVNCIEAIDCFNNGGTFDPGPPATCGASVNSCHDRDLVNGCFNFPNPGPAGSPKECNAARKDDCSIFCSVACSSTVACP
jgi:hypothetical protein